MSKITKFPVTYSLKCKLYKSSIITIHQRSSSKDQFYNLSSFPRATKQVWTILYTAQLT